MLDQIEMQDAMSLVRSYTVGPLDQAQVMARQVQLSTGDACMLLVPVTIPSTLFDHPEFQQGYEWGYLEGYTEEDAVTVSKLLNSLYGSLEDLRDRCEDPDMLPWTIGFVLGEIANVAEWDQTLALTGLAHVCFLLSFFTRSRPSDWPRYEPYNAWELHRCAVKAYRRRIRTYREQGKSFVEAQRLALC